MWFEIHTFCIAREVSVITIDLSIGGVANSVARDIFPLFVGLGYGCRRNSRFVRPIMVFDINGCGGVGVVLL